MALGFIRAARAGAVDDSLRAVAASIAAAGGCVAGTVPRAGIAAGAHPCDRDLIDLQSGQTVKIHQALGAGSAGCRLDAGALEAIVQTVGQGMVAARPDLLIVNRFGKLEAMGRGFVPVIAAALDAGIAVLVGVNDLNLAAFTAFAEDTGHELPDDAAAILDWLATFTAAAGANLPPAPERISPPGP